jgi:hypothetical protein
VIILKFIGATINKQPKIPVLFSVPKLGINETVSFLVDTGALYSALSEKQARLLGIDCTTLPETKGNAIGFGGLFKPRMINHPVFLTFGSGDYKHKISYSSGFKVFCIPPNTNKKDRETILRLTPSVLGMDVLSKFEVRITKKKVELNI